MYQQPHLLKRIHLSEEVKLRVGLAIGDLVMEDTPVGRACAETAAFHNISMSQAHKCWQRVKTLNVLPKHIVEQASRGMGNGSRGRSNGKGVRQSLDPNFLDQLAGIVEVCGTDNPSKLYTYLVGNFAATDFHIPSLSTFTKLVKKLAVP